ncbi:MAG: hypothetical protein RL380_200, partial [Verrucomicrobiota bacterium]
VSVAELPERGGMDEVNMARDEFAKRGVRTVVSKIAK